MASLQPAARTPRAQRLVTALGAAGLFCACFAIFSSVRGNVWFMDEMDNFALGVQMAKGSGLYTQLFSQHMPLMYYICFVFAKLGVHSVLGFRLAWYALLSAGYTALYLRYHRWTGRVPMLLWPVLYLLAITQVSLCTSILAEQLQAIGMVMLLLEFLHFCETRAVTPASAACIALGINMAFLSAFVAAFACAGIVLGYIVREVWLCAREKRGFAPGVRYLWKKYRLTILLTLAPLALLALCYVLTGVWGSFFYRAVTFNTTIYSKYQSGFGASGAGAVLGCLAQYVAFAKTVVQTLFQGARSVSAAVICLCVGQYLFLLWLLARRRVYAAVVTEGFFLLCGSRGFFNFHSLQCFALCAVMTALVLGGLWRCARGAAAESRANRPRPAKSPRPAVRTLCGAAFVLALAAVLTASGSVVWQRRASLLPTAKEFAPRYEAHSYETLITKLTDPGEYILENVNMEQLFLETEARMPSYNTAMSPWWWEGTRAQSMADIAKDPPRVAIYDADYTAWGYVVKDFAPEMDAFIRANYTQLYDDAPYFWVRSDYLAEAKAKLPQNDESMVTCIAADTNCGRIAPGARVEQRFTASRGTVNSIAVQFATYSTDYAGSVRVQLVREADGAVLFDTTLAPKTLLDNAYAQLSLPAGGVAVEQGQTYVLRITAAPDAPSDNLTVWADDGAATSAQAALVNGVPQSYNLCVKVR